MDPITVDIIPARLKAVAMMGRIVVGKMFLERSFRYLMEAWWTWDLEETIDCREQSVMISQVENVDLKAYIYTSVGPFIKIDE